jgi:5-methylcytosine-specific restriction endonuclease McrA
MLPHVANYYKAHGFTPGDFIPCELCGAPAVDIHHIRPRSHFGKKRNIECDAAENLQALCQECHEKIHNR